jgi:DNA-binding GntR family transcriptional regulator
MNPPKRAVAGPAAYRSKADVAYDQLRAAILAGDLSAGTALKQEQLALDLGVSTTPLREALRRLESEGFVKMPAHRDAIVAPLDLNELVALYEVRETLDSLAAGLAAQRFDEADRAAMNAAAGRLGATRADPVALNRALHASIYRASHNPVLIAELDSLWDRSDRYRTAIRGLARAPQIVESHRALVATVLSGDAKKATSEMRAHIAEARRSVEEAIAAESSKASLKPADAA